MKNIADQKLINLAKILEKPLYIVGGYVRNYLIDGSLSEDVDLTGAIKEEELNKALNKLNYKVIATYKHTGTVVFTCGKTRCEYTAFRSESYLRGEHIPDKVIFTDDITVDAKRRDFKCNAVYYDIKIGKFVDILGGIKDIKNKRLNTVVSPKKVFGGDGLRLMRLARFSSELNFKPTLKTMYYAKKYSKNISDISGERILEEIKKIFNSAERYPFSNKSGKYNGFVILKKTGVLTKILPELIGKEKESLKRLKYSENETSLLSLLSLIDSESKVLSALSELKVDNRTKTEINYILQNVDYNLNEKSEKEIIGYIIKNYKVIGKIGSLYNAVESARQNKKVKSENFYLIEKGLREIEDKKIPKSVKELKINGETLKKMGYVNSEIGNELNLLLLSCIINPEYNEKTKLIEMALKGLKRL